MACKRMPFLCSMAHFPLIDPPGAPLLKNQCSFLWQFCDEKSNYTFMKNHKKIIKKLPMLQACDFEWAGNGKLPGCARGQRMR